MSLQKKNKHVHFVGIGGAGMSGIADILIHLGHKVTGSDREKSEITDYLEQRGAEVFIGHKGSHAQGADYLIYSSAVPKDNPEMVHAHKNGIPTIRRAEMLGQLMLRKEGISIAGTHGKTTTTSLTGQLLMDSGLDPTVVVGGKMQNMQTSARLGNGKFFVTEADEYDRSFLTLFSRIAIITSLEEDHLDIYKDLEDIKQTFITFANQTTFDGLAVLCADHENVYNLKDELHANCVTYGLSEKADIRAINVQYFEGYTKFEVTVFGELKGRIKIHLPGAHNVQNALAAMAVGLELEVPFAVIAESFRNFKGVQRRFQYHGTEKGISFYDDYAHHPTEVEATLKAAKAGWKNRLVVAFQPHLYSRTKDFYKEFAAALNIADMVILADIYPAREKPIAGVTSQLIADNLTTKYLLIEDKNVLVSGIKKVLKEGDLFITMGAGDIWKTGRDLLETYKR